MKNDSLGNDSLVVKVDALNHAFAEGKAVLSDIHFQVSSGEIFMIMGGSGCGKTTIMNILMGILVPVSGSVSIFGQSPHDLSREGLKQMHRRCGMLFQFGALIESLTLLENVMLPMKVHLTWPHAQMREAAHHKLKMVGLQEHAGKNPSEISGGMRKRAALARAIALDPDLILADEPSSGLDPVTVREVDSIFLGLTKQIGAAAVVVSHDTGSFRRIADRAMLLGDERDGLLQGRMVMSGTQEEFQRSNHPLVQRFFETQNAEVSSR